jgi:polyhydroxyalkanoate synthesis regulator phasin
VIDALRGYVQLATGLTEVTVAKARETASAVLAQGAALTGGVSSVATQVPGADQAAGAAKVAASQVQELADDLVETSKQNRELLVGLVRTEVERAAGRMGYVREEELAAVRRHVSRLETQLAEVRAEVGAQSAARAAAGEDAAAEAAAGDEELVAEPAPTPKKKKVVVSDDAGADA